jgi:hypothetical protein
MAKKPRKTNLTQGQLLCLTAFFELLGKAIDFLSKVVNYDSQIRKLRV